MRARSLPSIRVTSTKDTMPLLIPCADCDPGTPPSRLRLDAARRQVQLNMTQQYKYAPAYSEGPVIPMDYRGVS